MYHPLVTSHSPSARDPGNLRAQSMKHARALGRNLRQLLLDTVTEAVNKDGSEIACSCGARQPLTTLVRESQQTNLSFGKQLHVEMFTHGQCPVGPWSI